MSRLTRLAAMLSMASIGLFAMAGGAMADTVTTDFEALTIGTVNGQGGWKSAMPGDVPALPNGYDQAVVAVSGIPGDVFGTRALRMSNAYTSGEFYYQTYSKSTTVAAGESLTNHEFDSTFSFISKHATYQSGLFISVSPDSYEGSRMSYVGLEDTPAGIRVWIYDTPDPGTGDFVSYDAGLLSRTEVHTVRFWIKLVPGIDNDIVRIMIDDVDIGDKLGVCFTTWENYYRVSGEQAGNGNTPPNLNSLEFRSSGTAAPALNGEGYLFDNVSVKTADGPGPAYGKCGSAEDKGAFCSPGYWKNASDEAWAKTGLSRSDLFNDVAVDEFYANTIGANPSLEQVLTGKGNQYGKAAGPFGLNPFNAVGAALTDALPGYAFDPEAYALNQELGIDTCPLDNKGGEKEAIAVTSG